MLLVRETPEAPYTIQALVIPLDCPSELADKKKKKSIAEDITHLGCKIQRNQTGTGL